MKAFVYIESKEIGKVDFSVIDESMGFIGGDFVPNESYEKYKNRIQKPFDKNRRFVVLSS